MRLAPLQLIDYYVTNIAVVTNPNFKPESDWELTIDTLTVSAKSRPIKEEPHRWMVKLQITQMIPEGKNIPYSFTVEMIGIIETEPSIPSDKVAHLVEVNGASMLFGAAREIIRAATGRGQFGPMLIPSATFYTPPPATNQDTSKAVSGVKKTEDQTSK